MVRFPHKILSSDGAAQAEVQPNLGPAFDMLCCKLQRRAHELNTATFRLMCVSVELLPCSAFVEIEIIIKRLCCTYSK